MRSTLPQQTNLNQKTPTILVPFNDAFSAAQVSVEKYDGGEL
jgi:hypothetical protein